MDGHYLTIYNFFFPAAKGPFTLHPACGAVVTPVRLTYSRPHTGYDICSAAYTPGY